MKNQPLQTFRQVLLEHAGRYPLMLPQDAVKLVFQSEFGAEHLVSDRAGCFERLNEEYEAASAENLSILLESIGGDFARMNLSAAKREGVSPEQVFERFLAAAEGSVGSAEGLKKKILLLRDEVGAFSFSPDELDKYLCEWRAKGFGCVSHTEEYRRAYCPSYRVVKLKNSFE